MKIKNDSKHIPPPKVSWQSSMEPQVISTSIEDESPKVRIKGKKAVFTALIIIAILILTISGIYNYVLPRVDIELVTVYHESTGGVASSGSININTQIRNEGTKTIEDINVSIEITNPDTDEVEAQISDSFFKITRGEKKEPRIKFLGDHYKPYKITIKISFVSSGRAYFKEYDYNIDENDAMNLIFEERIFEWRF